MTTIKQMAAAFLRNEHGFIITSEFLLSGTVTVLGLLVGISNIRNSVLYELQEIGAVIGKLNQSYSYTGVSAGDPLNGGPSSEGGLLDDALDPPDDLATTTLSLIDPAVDPTVGGES
jgi:hypothetical protein